MLEFETIAHLKGGFHLKNRIKKKIVHTNKSIDNPPLGM